MRSHRRNRSTTWLPITLVLYYWFKAVPVVLALHRNLTLDLLPLVDHHDYSDPSSNNHHSLKDGCWRYLEEEEGGGIWERMESNDEKVEPSLLSPSRPSSLSHISPHPLTVQMKRRRRSSRPHGDDWPPSLCKYGINSARGAGVRMEFKFTGSAIYLFSKPHSESYTQTATWESSISIDGRALISTSPPPLLLSSSSLSRLPPQPQPLLIFAQTNLQESSHTLEIVFRPTSQGDGYDDDNRVPFSHPIFSTGHIVYTKQEDSDLDGQNKSTRKFNDEKDVGNSGSSMGEEKGEETMDETEDLDSVFAGAADNQAWKGTRKGMGNSWMRNRNMRRQESPPVPSPPTPTSTENTSPPPTTSAPPPSTATESAPATTTSNASAKKRNVATFAAAVGGSVGVLALFSAGLALSIIRRRYRAKKRERLARQGVTATAHFPPMMTQTGGGGAGAAGAVGVVVAGATGIGEGVWGPVGSGFPQGQGPGGTRAPGSTHNNNPNNASNSPGGSRTSGSGSGSDGFVPRFFPSEVQAAPRPSRSDGRPRGLMRHLLIFGGRRRGGGEALADHSRSTDTDATMVDVDPPGYHEVVASAASSPLTISSASPGTATIQPLSSPHIPLPAGPPPGYDPSVQMIQHYPYIHRQPPRPPSIASSIDHHAGSPVREAGGLGTRTATTREGADMSYADNPPAEDPPPEVQAQVLTIGTNSTRIPVLAPPPLPPLQTGLQRPHPQSRNNNREPSDEDESSGDSSRTSGPVTPPGVPVPVPPPVPVLPPSPSSHRVPSSSLRDGLGSGEPISPRRRSGQEQRTNLPSPNSMSSQSSPSGGPRVRLESNQSR